MVLNCQLFPASPCGVGHGRWYIVKYTGGGTWEGVYSQVHWRGYMGVGILSGTLEGVHRGSK